ncbi:UDP-Glycosyltransferase/glycogen phosphorylase [Trametes punicea]|nr:UDP-Glycosyltransferase/glycogen phosphorylase [Trametes punicea]
MWGHARALAILGARMVRLRPVTVTVCIASKLYDNAKREIASDFAPGEEDKLSRIRLLRVEQGLDHLDPAIFRDEFLHKWKKLCDGESLPCESVDGIAHQLNLRTSPLSGVIVDGLGCEIIAALHEQRTSSSSPIPLNFRLYTWSPMSTNFIVANYRSDPQPFIEAFASHEGISFEKAAITLLTTKRGHVIESPCLPPMYDWEFEPQGFTFPHSMIVRIFCKASRILHMTDGMISIDAEDYHPEASAAMRDFMAQNNKEMYMTGPLIARGHVLPHNDLVTSIDQADELTAFMNRQLKTRGEKSIIYVSFGSLWWPLDLPKLVAALQVFVEQKIPFIIALSSPVANLPDDFVQKLKENSDVYLGDWLPQQAILDHPALGWCLTHGGHNTVLECINSGVPMIVWPITVDQPPNAVHLSEGLEIAYELIQVRTGTGAGPIYRTGQKPLGTLDAVRDELRGVLVRAFGADGMAKRKWLQVLRDTLARAWSDGEGERDGFARKEVEKLLDRVCAFPASTLD